MIWFKASVMGIVLSMLYRVNTNPGNSASKSCVHSLIYFVTQYLVYSLHPKSDWMLLHLKDKKQTQLWLSNYKTMKMKCILVYYLVLLDMDFYVMLWKKVEK